MTTHRTIRGGGCEEARTSGEDSPVRVPRSAPGVREGFSLIEILVVITLLSVIILGLLLMFNQTQRAYRVGMTQVDVLESGRVVTEMITRELLQITPTYQDRRNDVTNFFAFLPDYTPLLQPLPGPPQPGGSILKRTNVLEDLFFMRHENRKWYGVGYFVRTSDGAGNLLFPASSGIGTLYRFETNYADVDFKRTPYWMAQLYRLAANREGLATKVVEGVIHFKVRAYDTNGNWIVDDLRPDRSNSDIRWSTGVAPGEIGLYAFHSNAVPASVELELGVLEARTQERAKAIADPTARRQYLEDQSGRVHLFRLRVPIRNVDPAAYQ